jgi:hypothetical protein
VADRYNEGKALDAVLRFIEARDNAPRENDGRSPDDLNDWDEQRRVDYVCTVGQTLYAFEHTGIEPFPSQIRLAETTRSSSTRSSGISIIELIRRSGTFMFPWRLPLG